MPAAVPLVAAVAGAAATSALTGTLAVGLFGAGLVGSVGAAITAGGILASAAGFVVSSAINAVGGALTSKKPKRTGLTANQNLETIRSTIESHKIIYGQARVSGPILFDGATSSGLNSQGANVTGTNKFRHFVIALAGHEVEEIGTIYIENKAVTLNADGFVTDAAYGKTTTTESQIRATLSSAAAAGTGLQLTSSSAHGFLVGETVFIPVRPGSRGTEYTGYVIASVPSSTTFRITAGPQPSRVVITANAPAYVKRSTTTGRYFVRIKKFLGAADQAASPDLVNEISAWSSAHRLKGIAYLYVRIEQSPEVSLNIQNISAIVKGKKVYDPRTTLTTWSENAALCARDYLASDEGFDSDDDEINDTYCIAAANICDELVTKRDGTTQARYTCNGVLDTASTLSDNYQSLLTAMVGVTTYVQGKFRINAAAYDSPSRDIDMDMLAGDVDIVPRPSKNGGLFNAVKGVFSDASKDYFVTDFPMVTNSTYEAQDGGEQIPHDIELPFTTDKEAAQRIAKIILEKSRQGITVTLPLNHSALKFVAYETIRLTDDQMGWASKVYRIQKVSFGVPGPFTLLLQEEASASYDWNSGEATTIDPAPDTNLPDAFEVDAPGKPSVSEDLYETRDGATLKARATVSWGESPDRYARFYVLEYQRVEDVDWTVLPQTGATTQEILDIQPGKYTFRVKTLNHIDKESDYATSDPLEIFGLSATPADIVGLTIQGMWGQARLSWTLPEDKDVIRGGKILVRHSEATSGAIWEESTTIGHVDIPGSTNTVIVPLKAGSYLVKAEDSSRIQSINAAIVTTKGVSLLAFSDIVTVQEDPTFSGIHSGTIEDGGNLRITGGTLFDDIADVDALTNFDFSAGVGESGTYTFDHSGTGYTDLTTVQDIRLQSVIELSTENVLDLFDTRQSLIDDWVDFDGAAGGGTVDCWVEVSTTDDDPAGTPTWTDYNRVDVADVNCRAFRARAQLTSNDPAYNALVSTLSLTAKELA